MSPAAEIRQEDLHAFTLLAGDHKEFGEARPMGSQDGSLQEGQAQEGEQGLGFTFLNDSTASTGRQDQALHASAVGPVEEALSHLERLRVRVLARRMLAEVGRGSFHDASFPPSES